MKFRKRLIRVFFVVVIAAMVIDVLPPTFPALSSPKQYLSSILNRVGLWQGQWVMFSPNPVLNNAYITAEIEDTNGNIKYWDSPDWKKASTSEKFLRFRHMNFYNRIHLPGNSLAVNDFVNHLVRTDFPIVIKKLKLERTAMTMILPEPGTLPGREETLWISSTSFLTERHFGE